MKRKILSKPTVGMVIKRLANAINRRLTEAKRCIHDADYITGLQGWVIGYVDQMSQERDVFQKDIELLCDIGPSGATALLQRMEKHGLIVREPMPNDARWKRIILTQKAHDFGAKIIENMKGVEEQAEKGLSQEEIKTFMIIAERIIDNLEK